MSIIPLAFNDTLPNIISLTGILGQTFSFHGLHSLDKQSMHQNE